MRCVSAVRSTRTCYNAFIRILHCDRLNFGQISKTPKLRFYFYNRRFVVFVVSPTPLSSNFDPNRFYRKQQFEINTVPSTPAARSRLPCIFRVFQLSSRKTMTAYLVFVYGILTQITNECSCASAGFAHTRTLSTRPIRRGYRKEINN